MKYQLLLPLAFICCLTAANAQRDTLRVRLKDVVTMAKEGAPDVEIARTAAVNNYWRYQSYLANYKPQMRLNATLPNLNRSIQAITLPDGSDVFVNRALMSNLVNLTLEQDIALTGGSVFVNTGLERIDLFATSTNARSSSYLSTPIAIGFSQPLFQFNALRWDRKTEPLRYETAQRAYAEDLENAAYDAAVLFFDVLNAQLNLEAARRDKRDADTLLEISRGRYEVGRIAETELLQIELSAMNADADLAANLLNLQTSTEQLRNFLGITRAVFFDPVTPDELPVMDIGVDTALAMARRHRSESSAFQLQLQEARREVAVAEGTTGPAVTIDGYFALSQTGEDIGDAFQNPLDQERLNIRLSIPIADWGKAKSRRSIAYSNRELTQLQVEQARVNFEREIIVKVQQFSLQRNQVELAERAYNVARRQLNITRERYRIGKIGVNDLNISIAAEADARRAYVAALRNFWLAYYDLRRLTLYDFENQQVLQPQLPTGN